MSIFKIADERVAAGSQKTIQLRFSETYIGQFLSVPVRVIRAKKQGPIVALTGGIHGDELTGVGIIRELLYDNPPNLKCGTLVCVPVVNVYGLENHSRYLPDRRDLNRCFPGSPGGSMSSRLAHVIFNEVISKCDYLLDFHSAALRRTNYPNIRADLSNPRVKQLAKSFGTELIVGGKGPDGSLRRSAIRAGIPAIVLEAGEVWKNAPSVVEVGIGGVMNVLASLGMVDAEVRKPTFQVNIRKTTWVRAERGGFLSFHAKPGDLVEEGQDLATNYSIFGRERHILNSPVDGIVLGMTTMPAVKPGEPVYHVASLTHKTYLSIRKKIDASHDDSLFSRIQADLSTNILIEEKENGS